MKNEELKILSDSLTAINENITKIKNVIDSQIITEEIPIDELNPDLYIIKDPFSVVECNPGVPIGGQGRDFNPKQLINSITAPEGYHAVLAWFQCTTYGIKQDPTIPAKLYIDSMKLIEKNTAGIETVVNEVNYNEPRNLENSGSLYNRLPGWFKGIGPGRPVPWKIENGCLIIDASKEPSCVIHWWSNRVAAKPGCSYLIELNVKIEGKIQTSMGVDWWRELSSTYNGSENNNKEAWNSDMYGDTNGIFITIRTPHL